MSTLMDALSIARSLMNDDDGLNWTDAIMIPKVRQAWGELLAKFQLNGIQVILEETTPIAVTALATTLTLPTDFQTPIKLDEYGVNETIDKAIPMTVVDFIPTIQQEGTLRYWAWLGQTIQLLGATSDRNVLLYYIKSLDAPTLLSQTLSINQSEIFLGPRIASLCLQSIGEIPRSQSADKMAADNLSLVYRAQVKRMQNLPARRKPFSYSIRRRQRFSI